MSEKKAIIIGAGPAGLTAAFELLEKSDIKPVIFEMSNEFGGISRTIKYKGNRIDIGGHRFFSKSDRIMEWWKRILPLQGKPSIDDILLDREIPLSKAANAPDPEKTDKVMLARYRLSRIFFLRKFFDYPVTLSVKTLMNLGPISVIKIGFSYVKIRLFTKKEENNLEDFFINRFGKELYLTFFKDYTEKVWGVPCNQINPEWGAQRIKGLSISKAIIHALKSIFKSGKKYDLKQKETETSLIDKFMYPKFGPGQLWEEVAEIVKRKGGEIRMEQEIVGIKAEGNTIVSVTVKNKTTNTTHVHHGDYFISTMPIKDLITGLDAEIPEEVKKIGEGLMYRDFITVGILADKLKIKNETKLKTLHDLPPDNWIYIQERDVKIGRLQIFNNWSPYMEKDYEKTVWLGLEYFCTENDKLWAMEDEKMFRFAAAELEKIGILEGKNILDWTVIRVPKAYPSYFGSYEKFDELRKYLDGFNNLFLVGRNGMHKYNNQDHSMLAAMKAVENIIDGKTEKESIWSVNTENDYHEKK